MKAGNDHRRVPRASHRDNQSGSVLAWVMAVLMILMIVVCSVLALAGSSYMRVVKRERWIQAYDTAGSVAQVIADEIRDGSTEIADGLAASSGETIHIGGLEEAFGTCELFPVYDEENGYLKLTVTAWVGEETESVRICLRHQPDSLQADLEPIEGEGEEGMTDAEENQSWRVLYFGPGEAETEEVR